MFDDFDTQIQVEEIIPEEYDDWIRSSLCEALFSTEFNLDKKEYNEWAAWNNMYNSDITP